MDQTLSILAYISSVIKDDPKKPKLDRKDQKLADRIIFLLRQNQDGAVEISEETDLTTTGDVEIDEEWDIEQELEDSELTFKGIGSPQMVIFGNSLVSIERVQQAIDWYPAQGSHRNGSQKRKQPSTMYAQFRFLKTEKDLKRLVAYEKAGAIKPDHRAVIAFISFELYVRTIAAINSGHILHDSTLRAMISEIKDEFQIESSFYGSHNWLNDWKRAHRISSRSITKFVTRKNFTEKHVLEAKMEQFVKDARKAFEGYDPLRVYNLDQSGFQKELYTQRTLTTTGIQNVEVITSSANGVTHSYTVLPMLRLDGVLHPKLYVVFAESLGKFPPTITPYQADNLVIAAAKSHIMGKVLMSDFFERVVFTDEVDDDILLVADSWPCWTKTDVIDLVRPPHKKVDTIVIPAGATGHIQPLDIGIFRQFKKFIKNLSEYAQRKEPEFKIHQRDNIIKMVSQSYWCLCCPLFQEWRYYAWYAGGYVDHQPPQFDKPTDVCFNRKVYGPCEISGCNRLSMIFCGYCSKKICFQQFVIDCHRCTS